MFKLKTFLAGSMLCASSIVCFAQLKISGKVTNNKSQEPIAGATIRVANTFSACLTKGDGSYELKNFKPGTYILQISMIGYQPKTDTINLQEDQNLGIELIENTVLMDEVIVMATRVDDHSAMAYSTINKEDIAKQNLGQDLPYLLDQQTSVVTTSDAGAGVGYTGIRIRGIDATRINVTINGIPVNDAESQGTYWVDLPDIASSIDNIQLQRGVGTSTNGAGAFGGSLNIQTSKLIPEAYAEVNSSYGSFNTFKTTVNAGTGLLHKQFAIDARLSKINSDGFIDRAKSDLKSYYLSGAYYGKKSILKFITFSGYEETYQAWYGSPQSRVKGDVEGMNTYIANNYLDDAEANNLLQSNSRTYNPYTYENQVDHYVQSYYQLHFSHEFNSTLNANIAAHFTKGKGYYEEYKKDDAFANYGYDDLIIGIDTISATNLVRRRWLDNNFYGTTFSLNYHNNKNFALTFGGAWNKYDGLHYGEIIWAQYAGNSFLNQKYYNDTAYKTDFNVFLKANYLVGKKLNFFADLQYRTISYTFLGYDDSLKNVNQKAGLGFINPKIGVHYAITPTAAVYASYSIGNKEPSRDDYTQSSPSSRPKPETLDDIELGYKQNTRIAMWGLNLYYMNYKNQLVLTGEINDVGAYNRTNVDQSYRGGAEIEFGIKPLKWLSWTANITLSRNKIKNFSEYIDNYDSTAQRILTYHETDIAFSPNLIAGSTISIEPLKNLKLDFITKYIGKQFLDNTSNVERSLDAYLVNNFRINYLIHTKVIPELGLTLCVNNILNEMYESNGYTWGYISGGTHVVENFYYPQAGINFMAGLHLKF